jgi:hypothetical protein
MSRLAILAAALITLAISMSANADLLIDQSQLTFNAGGSGAITTALSGVGQLFTPSLNGIDFIETYVKTGASAQNNLSFNLYTTLGVQIGQTNTVSIAANYDSHVSGPVLFRFAHTINLTAGTQYAFIWNNTNLPTSGTNLTGYGTTVVSTYTGGTAVVHSAPAAFQSQFAEGVFTPEPATMTLGAIGLICLGGLRLLRRRPIVA